MQSIRKNIQAMTIAYSIQKVLAFVFFSLVARSLSASSVGVYSLALSLASVFGVFADFGISSMSVREFSGVDHIGKKIYEVFSVKVLLSSICFLALCVVSGVWYREDGQWLALIIAGIVMVFDTVQSTLFAGLRSRNDLRHEAISIVASQCITVLLGLVLSLLYPASWSFVAIFALSSFVSTVYAYVILKHVYATTVQFISPFGALKQTFVNAKAFGLASVFGRLYGTVDVILLHSIQGAAALGVYSVSTKIITAVQFVPYALGASLYPAFSATVLQTDEYKKRQDLFSAGGAYILAVGYSFFAGILLLSPWVVPAVFGSAYAGAVLPLRIAAFAVPCVFYTFVTGALLNAVRLQWAQTSIVFGALCVNAVSNSILIPQYASVGAATASVISSMCWVSASIAVLLLYKAIDVRVLARHAGIALLFLFIMLFGWWMSTFSFLSALLLIGIGYLGVVVFFRIVTAKDILGMLKI